MICIHIHFGEGRASIQVKSYNMLWQVSRWLLYVGSMGRGRDENLVKSQQSRLFTGVFCILCFVFSIITYFYNMINFMSNTKHETPNT